MRFDKFLFILIFSAFTLPIIAQEQMYKTVVKGRVVDELGNPVAGAFVHLEFEEDDELEDFKYNANTDSTGRFSVENLSEEKNRTRKLFVASPSTMGMNLVDIPSAALRKINNKFDGLPLGLQGIDEILELGDISVQVWFGTFELQVLGSNKKPLHTKSADWGKIELVIRDEKGNFIAGRGVSIEDKTKYINLNKSSIKLELPEGKWVVEIVKNLQDLSSVLAKSDVFEVKRGNSNENVKITIK